ncbi:MAG: dihydrolipoyl dehydrogenase [Acidobacteriota bacterium]
MPREESTDLLVLGAGPGGYAAAFLAADLGRPVCLVDPAPDPGGVCAYRGCIPSKALLHLARVLHESREAAAWGVTFGEPQIDLARVRAWKNDIVGKLTSGLGTLRDRRQVASVQGRGRFLDAHRLFVEETGGGERIVAFRQAIIATGSHPTTLPMVPADSPRVLDSTSALALEEIPQTLLVIGGGYIGLELGSVYAALGSRVTIVEMTESLLPGVDPDLARLVDRRLRSRVEAVHLGTRVVAVEERPTGLHVTFATGADTASGETGAAATTASELPAAMFDRVLVAVGRRPNSRGLGLATTQVSIDNAGFIEVDAARRTAEPTLFAIGDVAGQPMLAHKASHEGRTAVEAMHDPSVTFAPRAIPAVVFTDPEIAWCGLTEQEARAGEREVRVARFPWAASGRAATLGRTDGVTKVIVEAASEKILGIGIAGAGAGEMIAEGVLAMEMDATVADLKMTIHPHPTLSETMMEAAEVFFGQSTHVHRPRRGR